MNITFLIGNGFDRNLGLNTTYSDFTKHYKSIETNNETMVASFSKVSIIINLSMSCC